ncbi:hypothetical protein M3650_02945 [Paenibacillus sp. MER TA 81-3]|uniref:hypothetical protein n=1 Tax=Paenibacillus sp. MER TA 81-3 TaxID=2939573 RepID=UPI00203FACC2|nr:hypothetical protein [Paenibacillus sp. MER TA 81-3]MCM3337625.1 hypothetical protein [Paenibacillus sp. MER TA 81-3]
MLQDVSDSYLLAKEKFPDIVFDCHRPKEGLYVRLQLDQSWDEQCDSFEQNHLLIYAKEDIAPAQKEIYEWFRMRDYYSSLITMNKAVDTGKQIHSNNPFALYAKREVFLDEKQGSTSTMQEHVNRFLGMTLPDQVRQKWNSLIPKKSISQKGADPITPEALFAKTEYAVALDYLASDLRSGRVDEIAAWYAANLGQLTEFIRSIEFKNYIKLFFTITQDDSTLDSLSCENIYRQEYILYTIPKIFNSNDYNQLVDGQLVGLPSFNVSMNSKKPFNEHKSMRVQVPVRVTLQEAILMKQASEWLLSKPKYVMNKFSYESDFTIIPASRPQGAYHVYVDGKENEVLDYENVPFPTEMSIKIRIQNVLGTTSGKDKDRKEYPYIENTEQLQREISRHFFRGRMNGQFVRDEPKPKHKDFTSVMAALFMQSRQAFHDWLFKGTELTIRPLFARTTVRLIEEQMLHVEPAGQNKGNQLDLRWLADAMNVRLSLISYLERNEGGRTMSDRITGVMDSLKDNLAVGCENICKDDMEFYFLAGQLAYYLKSQSETQQKKGDLLEPFLMARRSDQLKKRLEEAYILHKHKIRLHHEKFNRAFSSVFGYKPEAGLEGDAREMFMAGLFAENWFYEKGEKSSMDKVKSIDEGADLNGEEE